MTYLQDEKRIEQLTSMFEGNVEQDPKKRRELWLWLRSVDDIINHIKLKVPDEVYNIYGDIHDEIQSDNSSGSRKGRRDSSITKESEDPEA